MQSTPDHARFDKQVRAQIYAHFLQAEQAPRLGDVARALGCPLPAARAAYRRLAEARAIVLQADGEVLMAEPFSAVPTPFSWSRPARGAGGGTASGTRSVSWLRCAPMGRS